MARTSAISTLVMMLLVVSGFTAGSNASSQAGKIRTYYIAADEVDWDYAPGGVNKMMGMKFEGYSTVFTERGPHRIGTVYRKRPGVCPDILKALEYFDSHLEINSPQVEAMIRHLIEHRVAITSTLAVDADFSGAMQPLDVMRNRELRALGWRSWLMYRMIRRQLEKHPLPHLLIKEMRFEREFAAAGGTLLAGSDPTGDGGTLAGYGDQREIELLVQAGFTPEEAIHISTANGAEFLNEASRIGTIAVGKQADLFVVLGDPSRHISDIRNVELVFRKGVGYSSSKLFAAVRGLVGTD